MTSHLLIILFVCFFAKHFVIDFPLQKWKWIWGNKHDITHPGGYVHAGLHFFGTLLILWLWLPILVVPVEMILLASLADFVLHYWIDNAKMNIGRKMNWQPDNSNAFYTLLGFDQLLHYLTYAGIIWYLT